MSSSSSARSYRPTLLLIAAFFVGGLYQAYRYLPVARKSLTSTEMGKISRLQTDFEGTLATGEEKKVSDLKGKVLVFFPFRTGGEQAVDLVAELKPLIAEFATEPRVHWVGITVEPEVDDATRRMAWAKTHDLVSPQVWLMNGRTEEVLIYLTKQLGLRPIRKRERQEAGPRKDSLFWDSWVVLVDSQAHIRRRFDLALADPDIRQLTQRELRNSIKSLLNEKELPSPSAAR